MFVNQRYIEKRFVTFCNEKSTLEDVLGILAGTSYLSLPVLDKTETKFLGIVYKVDIYEQIQNKPERLHESILGLVKENQASIHNDAPFYKVLFTMRRLPFVAVLNEAGVFLGIVTHETVMDFLEDSMGLRTHGYLLTVVSNEYKGALTTLVSTIKEHCSIESLVTLDSGDKYLRRISVTLPKDLTDEKMEEIRSVLEHKGYRVTYFEKIGV